MQKRAGLILFLITGIFSMTVTASEGGLSGGGGGTSVVYQGQRILIDLLMLADKIPAAQNRQRLVTDESFDPVQVAQEILNKWDAQQLAISSLYALTSFDSKLVWSFTDNRLPLSQRFFVPPAFADKIGDPQTVAFYSANSQGLHVLISKPALRELDQLSQVATVVHESLRHIQIGLKVKDEQEFDEETLQEATAIYMLCKPNNALSMYVNFLLANKRSGATSLYGDLPTFVATHCKSQGDAK